MEPSVLIVDDDAVFRGLAARMLRTLGLAVAGEAADAQAAIAAANRLKPTAVLVDVGLPDRGGEDLARELAALPWRPRIVLTSSDADAVPADRDTGAFPFVPKDELPNGRLRGLLAAG